MSMAVTYYINAKRFELYMAGEDMKGAAFS